MSRWFLILLGLSACDNKQDTAPAPSSSASSAVTAAAVDASPADASTGPRAERPIPLPGHMVSDKAPLEQQQKAVAYMIAMRAPRSDDPNSDPTYAADLAEKLKPISLSLDNGGDKAKLNRTEVVGNGRQIDMLMSGGCDEKTPNKAVVQRLSTPFATLAQHGVLVVRCNDAKIQCLQSTRDVEDILCTTAPRHK